MAGIFDRIAGASGTDETELTVEPIALDDGMDDEQPLMSAAVQVDERRTPQRVREAVQEMLKYGLLEESHKPNLYRSALANIEAVDTILEPLDLVMGIDEVRGLVFVTVRQGEVADQDDWSHPPCAQAKAEPGAVPADRHSAPAFHRLRTGKRYGRHSGTGSC